MHRQTVTGYESCYNPPLKAVGPPTDYKMSPKHQQVVAIHTPHPLVKWQEKRIIRHIRVMTPNITSQILVLLRLVPDSKASTKSAESAIVAASCHKLSLSG